MANQSETGHAKNVANFSTLVSAVNGFGASYNPSKQSITPGALASLAADAQAVIKQYNGALGQDNLATAARKVAFLPLSKLATRILNALRSSDTTEQVVSAAESLVRKIRGTRATPKKTDEEKAALLAQGTTVREVSSSKMSYDNRLDSFDKLIQLLTGIPQYAPNEEDLQTATLTNYYNTLNAANVAATKTETQLNNARLSRNKILYKPGTGLVDTASAVKAYVRSVFGIGSSQDKQITGLAFKPDDSYVASVEPIAATVV